MVLCVDQGKTDLSNIVGNDSVGKGQISGLFVVDSGQVLRRVGDDVTGRRATAGDVQGETIQ